MTPQMIMSLARETLTLTAMLACPLLLAGLITGLAVSIFQTVTSIHEQTLTFVPKMAVVLAALIVALPWMLQSLQYFTTLLLSNLARYGR